MDLNIEDIMAIEEFKDLKRGQILHDKSLENSDGTPWRWRVNGKVKTWKRDPQRFRIPIKRGLYDYDYVDEHNFRNFVIVQEGY